MSVDTYLKGKRMSGNYRRYDVAGVEFHVANTLSNWAERVDLDVRRFLVWRRVKPRVEHQHRPT